MISLIIIGIAFAWLGYETNWMTIRLLSGKEGFMKLPSGTMISEADFEYLRQLIKPPKVQRQVDIGCWYCNNGHDRQHLEMGLLSYDLCECGASILIRPKRRRVKRMRYAKLAGEVATILRRNTIPAIAAKNKTKAMI